jgi:hypothetical protein
LPHGPESRLANAISLTLLIVLHLSMVTAAAIVALRNVASRSRFARAQHRRYEADVQATLLSPVAHGRRFGDGGKGDMAGRNSRRPCSASRLGTIEQDSCGAPAARPGGASDDERRR